MKPGEPKDAEGLFTAQDLFGDLVDAPLEGRSPGLKALRKEPIRVQVSEPGGPIPAAPKVARTVAEVPPEEMAALLNAFDAPHDEAPATPPAPAEVPEIRVPEIQVPAPAEPEPAPGRGARAGEVALDLDTLIAPGPLKPAEPPELLDEATPPPWNLDAQVQPPKTASRAPDMALESFVDPPPTESPAPPPAHETMKFSAATPYEAPPVQEDTAIDLAAVAEDALRSAPTQAFLAPPTASGRMAAEQAYGPYQLLEKVAVGGMAEVFKAKRPGVEGFEKVLAVKRILAHLSDNEEFVDMFIDEAKMVAGLSHPSIVQIFDLGRIEKSYYIAMEYVHGRDLRSILKRAKERSLRLPLDLSALIVGRVCAALEYAHRKKDDRGRPMRIVHRDVSPQNILISFEGDVKLTDFGIAKAVTKANTTERGALRGKLLYMSPEQAWGKPMDRRSDIFSLGIVFYEMMTEDKPFLAQSEMSILEMVRQCRVAPPGQLNPRIPARLEAVVMKALDKDPEHRYQEASEMARDLERALPDRKVPASTELARFMEILFDREERGDMTPDEHPSGEHRLATERKLDVQLERTPPLVPTARPAPQAKDMSIDKLLKRFGIK